MKTLSSPQAWLGTMQELVAVTTTWWQLLVVFAALLLAWGAGQLLQRRLQPMVQPGIITGVGRTAVRTGFHALIPVLWYLILLAARSIFRRQGLPIDILQVAMYLVGALALIRMGVFILRHSFSPGSRLKAWEWSLTTTIWVLVSIHVLGLQAVVIESLDEYALVLGTFRISLFTIVSFVLSIALLSLLALWLTNGIQALLKRTQALDDSIKLVIGKLSRFLLLALAVVVALVMAGIDLTALAVFGGALGVGVGLGLQRIISNFVSGIILAFERSIRPGDVLKVGETFGVVQALHARHMVVRDRDGRDILIPNETLMTSEIINWSYGDPNVRFRLPVQISYRDDPESAMAILVRAARETERVLADPEPAARLMGFGDNGINLELRLWIRDPENGVNNVRSEVYTRIWRDFRDAGITIPFPQRDVRLVTEHSAPAASPSRDTTRNRPESAHGQTRGDAEGDPD